MHTKNFHAREARRIGKRASYIFEPVLVVTVFLVLLYAYLQFSDKKDDFETQIGEKQYSLLNAYKSAELSIIYLDLSASQAGLSSVHRSALLGGLDDSCPSYYGYRIWDPANQPSCTPSKTTLHEATKKNFLGIFKEKINAYPSTLANIPTDIFLEITLSSSGDFILLPRGPIEISTLTKQQIHHQEQRERSRALIEETLSDYSKTASRSLPSSDGTSPSGQAPHGLVKIIGVSCEGSCTLRPDAFAALIKADTIAKQKGLTLHVYSSYRSLEHQKALWEGRTEEKYAQRFPDPAVRGRKVCNPNQPNVYNECPHLTGGAIDIKFKGKTDSQMTQTEWKTLERIMKDGGFVRYAEEEWHFEYGTTRWAMAQEQEKKTGKEVVAIT